MKAEGEGGRRWQQRTLDRDPHACTTHHALSSHHDPRPQSAAQSAQRPAASPTSDNDQRQRPTTTAPALVPQAAAGHRRTLRVRGSADGMDLNRDPLFAPCPTSHSPGPAAAAPGALLASSQHPKKEQRCSRAATADIRQQRQHRTRMPHAAHSSGAGRQGFNRSGSRPAFLCGVPLCLAWCVYGVGTHIQRST
jgi:hypothetical protein